MLRDFNNCIVSIYCNKLRCNCFTGLQFLLLVPCGYCPVIIEPKSPNPLIAMWSIIHSCQSSVTHTYELNNSVYLIQVCIPQTNNLFAIKINLHLYVEQISSSISSLWGEYLDFHIIYSLDPNLTQELHHTLPIETICFYYVNNFSLSSFHSESI